MKFFLIKLIEFYQKFISPFKIKSTCIYYPTCSEFSKVSIQKYGVIKGVIYSFLRIFRCWGLFNGCEDHPSCCYKNELFKYKEYFIFNKKNK